MGWGWGAFTYQACLLCFAGKGEEATENGSKTDNQAVVRKAETKKKLQQSGMQKAQGSLLVLNSKELVLSL